MCHLCSVIHSKLATANMIEYTVLVHRDVPKQIQGSHVQGSLYRKVPSSGYVTAGEVLSGRTWLKFRVNLWNSSMQVTCVAVR